MPKNFLIETPRLTLRLVHPNDAFSIAPLVTDNISRWTATWPPSISEAEVRERFISAVEAFHRRDGIVCVILCNEDSAMMGLVGLHKALPESNRASLGFWIGEAYWGHGYATEAALYLVDSGWNFLGVDFIEASTLPDNAASISVLRKLGMCLTAQKTEFTPVRNQNETCDCFEIARPDHSPSSADDPNLA